MEIKIREMTAGDYPQVIELWRACEGIGLSADDTQEGIGSYLSHNPGLSFVAEQEGQVVGAVLVGQDGRRGYLNHLAVKPSHRNLGIGSELVRASLSALRAMSIRKCHIFVFADNLGVLTFWKKVGWEERSDLKILSTWI